MRWGLTGFVLALSINFAPPSSLAQKKAKPLAKHEIIYLLTFQPPTNVIGIVRDEGVAFELTPEAERDLRAAGATDALLEAVRQLAPKGPVLVIQSSPGNAQVFVDDELIARTSPEGRLKISTLSAGEHRVRISMEGYRDYERSLTFMPGRTETLPASLETASPQPIGPASPAPAASGEAARALRTQRPPGPGTRRAAPQWKSREEYDAYNAMWSEKNLNHKISLGEAFIQGHADSDFRATAYVAIARAHLEQRDIAHSIEAANGALDADPDNLDALGLLAYVFPYAFKPGDLDATAKLSQADADARHGLELLSKFSKPANVTDEQFTQYVKSQRSIYNGAIAFAALQRKDYAAAIVLGNAATEDNPRDTYSFYRLGLAYLYSTPRDYDHAVWSLARAVTLAKAAKDPNGDAIEKYLRQIYVGYHGNDEGLADVLTEAGSSPTPPQGFRVAPMELPKPTGNAFADAFNQMSFPFRLGGERAQKGWEAINGQSIRLCGSVDSVEQGNGANAYLVRVDILDQSKAARGVYDIELGDSTQPGVKNLGPGDRVCFDGAVTGYSPPPRLFFKVEGEVTTPLPEKRGVR